MWLNGSRVLYRRSLNDPLDVGLNVVLDTIV